MRALNLKGIRVGRLIVLEPAEPNNGARWLCVCDCGNYCRRRAGDLNRGGHLSCGCYVAQRRKSGFRRTHGLSRHRLYSVWSGMIRRCEVIKDREYKNYGGRGIKVCDRWKKVDDFISDMHLTYEEGLMLDRIDPNGNYEPANCRWVDPVTSANNRRAKAEKQSNHKGVYWDKRRKRWRARVDLGYFDTEEEAYEATKKLEMIQ